ncbi:MAG: type II toxin-antitoxin system RelE/ParE family toxin [Simkaniaceae bacterium]|nr:type II toxin-antitoxin system RelE/ParE family toxin [Simkaniaceae bacterium]
MEVEIELYTTQRGRCPFDEWFVSLREPLTKAKILTRLDRLKLGNLGDSKTIGDGVYELRIHYGPGIRIYFSRTGQKIILLLSGGNKSSQTKDIKTAKEYIEEYRSRRGKNGKK